MARELECFLRRGTRVRRLFLYPHHTSADRVFFPLSPFLGLADVEWFGQSVQGVRGDGIVADRLLYAAGGESGIRAVEVSIHQTLDPRAGPIRPRSGASATWVSHSPRLLFHISLQPLPSLGGGHCSDFAGQRGRHAFAAFLLLVELWSLGLGDARFVGTACREPPSFYPVLFFRSDHRFCVDVLAP
jgi:hypothetical protein